jgi:hypothetical protein
LVNFTASGRKGSLIPFGLFSPDDNLGFIYSITSGTGGTPQPLTGTINGVNRIFTTPTAVINGLAVYRNGILQDPALSYSLSGNTVTFNAANIPQTGDDLVAIVS